MGMLLQKHSMTEPNQNLTKGMPRRCLLWGMCENDLCKNLEVKAGGGRFLEGDILSGA